ncbi:MAG: hypothetical protein R3F56_20750 [Planctomycetota bacterium]
MPQDQVVLGSNGADAIWARGATYKAILTSDTFQYVPFFGSDAERDHPLSLTLLAVRTGSTPTMLDEPALRRSGQVLSVERGAVVERYRVGARQVEQDFVIRERFAGALEVELRVQTELVGQRDRDGLVFASPLGHVHYGDAVLVDAHGDRLPMQTRLVGNTLTLSASAATIAAAVFPITVDPILRTFTAQQSSSALTFPDIAFSAVSGRYLVVWTVIFSTADYDLHAVEVDRDGNIVPGSLSLLDISTDSWQSGRVAASGSNFLAVATRTPNGGSARSVWGVTRSVGSNTVGTPFEISGPEFGDKVRPDVGGEFAAPSAFCVVWQRNFSATDHDIHYRMVTTTGTPIGSVAQIDNSNGDDYSPRIANSDGALPSQQQVWPVTWVRQVNGQRDIYGARVRWNGNLDTPTFPIDTAAADDDTEPCPTSLSNDLAGGRYWLVAFTTAARGDQDIYLRVFRDGTTPAPVHSGFLADREGLSSTVRVRNQSRPHADTDGSRFAVSYLDEYSPTDRDIYVSTLYFGMDLFLVEARAALSRSVLDTSTAGLVANRSGGGEALRFGCVWDLDSPPTSFAIEGSVYQGVTPNGGFSRRATACGGLQISYASGSPVPAPGQTIRFDLSGASGPEVVFLGAPASTVLCRGSTCQLGTTMAVMLLGSTLTLSIPNVPSLIHATIAVQGGAVGTPGGCANLGQAVVSDTVDVTIR